MTAKKVSYAAVLLLLLLSFIAGMYLVLAGRIADPSIERRRAPDRIGVVSVSGEIFFPLGDTGLVSRRGAERIINTLEEYRVDPTVKAVILRINSPGGSIGAIQEITREIKRIKEEGKPVVASIADLGASGGYYIAAPADSIVANKGSIVGSIGVIMASPDFSRLMDKIGLDIETIKSGEFKDAGSFHRPLTGPEREYLQEMVDDAFEQFVDVVASGRNIPVEDVMELARGQIYTGRHALKLNLVDEIGGFVEAVSIAEELAGISDAAILRERHYDIGTILRLLGKKNLFSFFPLKDSYSGISYLYTPR